VTGDCTGLRCVRFKVVEGIPCNWDSAVGGCAYRLDDGSCQVEVASYKLKNPARSWVDELITSHEAGHCIWSYGGKSTAFHLPEDPHALMSPTHSGSPSKHEAKLTRHDRAFTRTLVFG